jgi:hypothetical protein
MSVFKSRWYGLEGGTDRQGANEVPRVQRIKGIVLVESVSENLPVGVVVHYDSTLGPQKLMMEYGEALFLLSALKSAQLDMGTPFPADPREGGPPTSIQ